MKVIIASHNEGKIKEFKKILIEYNLPIELISLKDIQYFDEIIEDGKDFCENALIKAKTIYDIFKIPTIADDSGLEVDALGGKPGIYSARYSQKGDEENNKLLLKNMKNIKNRKARFRCAICYFDGEAHYFCGECEGEIGYNCQGVNGFGYDSLFIYNNQTFADIPDTQKNLISHRRKAIDELMVFLINKL